MLNGIQLMSFFLFMETLGDTPRERIRIRLGFFRAALKDYYSHYSAKDSKGLSDGQWLEIGKILGVSDLK